MQVIVASLDPQYAHRGEPDEVAAPHIGQFRVAAAIVSILTKFVQPQLES